MVVAPDAVVLEEPVAGSTPPALVTQCMTAVRRFDLWVDRAVARPRGSRRVGRAMYALSAMGDDGRVWIAASLLEAARRRDRPVSVLGPLAWLAGGSAVVNLGLKRVARRGRPASGFEHAFAFRVPSDTSFPSGHAASGALMAVILSESSPMAPVWVALAIGIGASRVYVGVHHASDVVAGWAVGALLGAVARRGPGAASDHAGVC